MQRTALITGASSGMGLQTAELLVNNGWRVFGSSRKHYSGSRSSQGFTWVQMDLDDESSIREAAHFLQSQCSRIHLLVNNAGVGYAAPLEDTTTDALRQVFQSNVFGPFLLVQQCLPVLKSGNATIIHTSSIGGAVALPHRGPYCASKFALEGLVESWSMELKKYGIRNIILQPGDFKTGINAARKTADNLRPENRAEFEHTLAVICREVENGSDPSLVARKVLKLVGRRSAPLRIPVGKWFQRITPHVKYWLPSRMFERQIMKHYGIPTQTQSDKP